MVLSSLFRPEKGKREKKTISLIFHRAQGHWDSHPVKPMCFPTFECIQSLARASKRTSHQRCAATFIGVKPASRVNPVEYQWHSLMDNLRSTTFLPSRHRFQSGLFYKLGIRFVELQNSRIRRRPRDILVTRNTFLLINLPLTPKVIDYFNKNISLCVRNGRPY